MLRAMKPESLGPAGRINVVMGESERYGDD
jgi:hypothetical protein